MIQRSEKHQVELLLHLSSFVIHGELGISICTAPSVPGFKNVRKWFCLKLSIGWLSKSRQIMTKIRLYIRPHSQLGGAAPALSLLESLLLRKFIHNYRPTSSCSSIHDIGRLVPGECYRDSLRQPGTDRGSGDILFPLAGLC